MRKTLLLVLCLVLGATQLAQAQIDFGIKAGVNYNSDSFQAVTEDVLAGAESKTGFHAGIWTRFKLPVVGLYIRPELVYTSLKNEVSFQNAGKANYNFQKIDVPVLIGKKFLKVANVFVGPSFQYIIDGDISLDGIKEIDNSAFTVGVQLGAGVEFGKLGLDVRWERGFSDTESSAISNVVNTDPEKFDTRVNQIIVGLSYKF